MVQWSITTATGSLTAPPGSPKILIHTRHGKAVGIHCDQPAKILQVETRDDPRPAVHQAMPSMINPQTSVEVVGGYDTSVSHMLAMAFDDASMDADLCEALVAHEVVLG